MHKGYTYVSVPKDKFVQAVPIMCIFCIFLAYHGHMYKYCAYVSVPKGYNCAGNLYSDFPI